MSRYVDTAYCEDTMIWVELDEYPEAYYAINDNYDIETLMCADEDNNGASLDHLSDSEKEEIAGEIKSVFGAHFSENVIEGAQPTDRLLDGTNDHEYAEEWREVVEHNGDKYNRYYLFNQDDIEWDGGDKKLAEDYPWDADHVSRVEVV